MSFAGAAPPLVARAIGFERKKLILRFYHHLKDETGDALQVV